MENISAEKKLQLVREGTVFPHKCSVTKCLKTEVQYLKIEWNVFPLCSYSHVPVSARAGGYLLPVPLD